ncbi:MAG: hypothetical protein ACYC3X_22500 [Pirellulaceae bacterium]
MSKWSFDFALQADSLDKVPVTWKLPAAEGGYWPTVRMTGVASRPVLSQRFVRAILPPTVTDVSKQRSTLYWDNRASIRLRTSTAAATASARLSE